MFFIAKELWSQGTAGGHLFAFNPSSCRKLEPLSCSLPKVTLSPPYSSSRPPASLLCRAALFRALVPPAIWNGPDSPSHSPLAHSVFCPSQASPDDPLSPQEQRPYHAVLASLDPLFSGCLECVRHPRYDRAASFAPHCQRQDSHTPSLCASRRHTRTLLTQRLAHLS